MFQQEREAQRSRFWLKLRKRNFQQQKLFSNGHVIIQDSKILKGRTILYSLILVKFRKWHKGNTEEMMERWMGGSMKSRWVGSWVGGWESRWSE